MSTAWRGRFAALLDVPAPEHPVRRVRHEVRDGVAVIVFSATACTSLAMALLVLTRLAG